MRMNLDRMKTIEVIFTHGRKLKIRASIVEKRRILLNSSDNKYRKKINNQLRAPFRSGRYLPAAGVANTVMPCGIVSKR